MKFFASILLPLLAAAVHGDGLRDLASPTNDAEAGRELWSDWDGWDGHHPHHKPPSGPSCVWSNADTCPHGGKGHCDSDQWTCESWECKGYWHPKGCGHHKPPHHKPPHHKPPHWEPEQCDVPKLWNERETRAECCPCCNRKVCSGLYPDRMPGPPTDVDAADVGQGTYDFIKYASKQVEKCGAAYFSFEDETDWEVRQAFYETCTVGTQEEAEDEADDAEDDAEVSGGDGTGTFFDLRRNRGFLNRVLRDPYFCAYDDEGNVLESPEIGPDPDCPDGPGFCRTCPGSSNTTPRPEVISDSFIDCCEKLLGLDIR